MNFLCAPPTCSWEPKMCLCVCMCSCVTPFLFFIFYLFFFFRRLPGVVQRAWALYPGAERLALRLPDWMEWAWMQRCHGNWLQWWNRQRRRWHSKHHLSFSISFSLPYLFHFCLSGRLSIPFHYFRSCFPCREIFLIVPPLHPSVLSQSCWDSCRVLLVIITLNMYLCVCVCVRECVCLFCFFLS